MEANTIAYVFSAKKPELRRLVVKYGLSPAKNDSDLWRKTNYLIAKFKKEMLKDIAYIHPDRELVLWSLSSDKKDEKVDKIENKIENKIDKIEDKIEKLEFSNCNGNPNCNCGIGVGKKPCGCGCGCSDKKEVVEIKSNAEGDLKNTLKNNMPLVVVGSLLLVGGLILFSNRA